MTSVRRSSPPFIILWRTFLSQFLNDESVTSEAHLRQALFGLLAFLLVPGLFLLIEMFPEFASAAIHARFGRGPASYVDDMLEWIAFLLTTYAMVSVGFITILSWNALTFDKRDAMVLGVLPLRSRTILGAKLAALGTLLAAAAIPINMLNSFLFAVETSDQFGCGVFVTHFFAMLAATIGAAVLTFAAIVCVRGFIVLVFGPAIASVCGPPLQFLCVVAPLCLAILSPAVAQVPFMSASMTKAMPSEWFAALFEQLRSSPRAFDPRFQFPQSVRRALMSLTLALVGALAISVIEFRRQMHAAVAPAAKPGWVGRAQLSRTIAKWLCGRNAAARAIADFILITVARNRAQLAPIAINAGLGVAIVIAALSRNPTMDSVMRPRTAVLWIPLVMTYWIAIGLRASFFVPSELRANWSFRANTPARGAAHFVAVRSAMVSFVLPRTLTIVGCLVPLVGWRIAAWHGLLTSALTVLLVEILVLTIRFIPYTRAHEPGHTNLKLWWPVYALGLYLFAYWPARLEMSSLNEPMVLVAAVVAVIFCIALVDIGGRRIAGRGLGGDDDSANDFSETIVLDLSGFVAPSE